MRSHLLEMSSSFRKQSKIDLSAIPVVVEVCVLTRIQKFFGWFLFWDQEHSKVEKAATSVCCLAVFLFARSYVNL
jgi:hypothetical protein